MKSISLVPILKSTKAEVSDLISQVQVRIVKNKSIVRDSGLMCEILALKNLYADITYSKDWFKSAMKMGGVFTNYYTKKNTFLSVSMIITEYKKLRARHDRNFLTVLSYLDVVDLEVHHPEEVDQCIEGILKGILNYGWKEIYPVLSLFETVILTHRGTAEYLLYFLKNKFRSYYQHKSWKIREKAATILSVCTKHQNNQIKEIAQTIYERFCHEEKDLVVKYVLSHPLVIFEASISYLNGQTTEAVKISLNNLKPFPSIIVGRTSEIQTIRNELSPDKQFSRISIVSSEGVGKSILSHKLAIDNVSIYDIIWWVNSESQDSFNQSLYDLAIALKLEFKDIKQALCNLKVYLSDTRITKLLIFDNTDRHDYIDDFLPTSGHFLYTSSKTQVKFPYLQLNPLSTNESLELFSHNPVLVGPVDRLNKLFKLLGYLPLALVQAYAYLSKSNTTVTDYIESLSGIKQPNDILSDLVSRNIHLMSNEARCIFQIICLVYTEDIPYNMILSIFKDRFTDADTTQFNSYIRELTEFSLVYCDLSKGTLTIHQIIHEFARLHFSKSHNEALISSTRDYFMKKYKYDRNIIDKYSLHALKQLSPHMQKFLEYNKNSLDNYHLAILTTELAHIYIYILLDSTHSLPIIEKASKLLDLDSSDNPNIATAYNILGDLYKSVGNHDKSERCFLKCLEMRQRVLPPDHLHIAAIYNDLGLLYYSTGNYKKSEENYTKSKDIRLRVLPRDHPIIASTYNNLGILYYVKGNYLKAEKCLIESRNIREKVLPPNHPHIAANYNSLGELYYSKGEYSKAEECFIKSRDIRIKVLPSNSTHLAATFNNLGLLCQSQHNYELAEEYYLKSSNIYEKVLPKDHLDITKNYHNRAGLYQAKEEYDKSEEYYIKCRDIYKRVTPNSPSLATTYHNLAVLYYVKEDLQKAEENYILCKDIRERVLPQNSLSTATTYQNLGLLYYTTGEYKKAQIWYVKCKDIREKVLPFGHSSITTIRNHLQLLKQAMPKNSRSKKSTT